MFVLLAVGLMLALAAAGSSASRKNACINPVSRLATCRWDVRVDVSSDYSVAGDSTRVRWVATFKNQLLGFDEIPRTNLPRGFAEKDSLNGMKGGGPGVIAGTVSFHTEVETPSAPSGCTWSRRVNGPAFLELSDFIKLNKPFNIKQGEWNFTIHSGAANGGRGSGFDEYGDPCKPGSTDIALGGPEVPYVYRSTRSRDYVTLEDALSAITHFEWWKPIPRLPYPATAFLAGKTFTISKSWSVSRGERRSGHMIITFTRRR
jgi:hypothetical protein